jgi:hypothetical protein
MVHFYGANRHEIAGFWTGSIRGVQQAPRIRVHRRVGNLKGLVEMLVLTTLARVGLKTAEKPREWAC